MHSKGEDVAQKKLRSITLNPPRLDHSTAGRKLAPVLRSHHLRRLAAFGAVFPDSGPGFCEDCGEEISLRRLGRCILRAESDRVSDRLRADQRPFANARVLKEALIPASGDRICPSGISVALNQCRKCVGTREIPSDGTGTACHFTSKLRPFTGFPCFVRAQVNRQPFLWSMTLRINSFSPLSRAT